MGLSVFLRPAQTISECRWGASSILEPRCVPDVSAELLDNIQALDMSTCAFKQVMKMVDDKRGLWTCTQVSDE